MKTKAVRLYGKNDLRLEEFDLPAIKDDEILASVTCDSLCMSSYKASRQGVEHKRIPKNAAENPILLGHEFSGQFLEVGAKWKHKFNAGDKFSIQPALNYEGGPVGLLSAPGYSYPYIGGDATHIIIPNEVMEMDCILPYFGDGFYPAALAEPLSCVIGALHANYHTSPASYVHRMEIAEGGNMAILAGVGPMGLCAIHYTINGSPRKPKLLAVTDRNQDRLDRAASLYTVEQAKRKGVELKYINTSVGNPAEEMMPLTGNKGYDDVFVFAAAPEVIEQADSLLAFDGCLNFFAGPTDPNFKAPLNFYNVHYNFSHIVSTSGGNKNDMKEALALISNGFDLAGIITHVGGLDAVIPATLNLPSIHGGKKLMYTHLSMPLTAIDDFEEKGKTEPLFAELDKLCKAHRGLWNLEAEKFLMANGKKING